MIHNMKCYIIPVGGTGERVMRSLIHLLASGVLNDKVFDEINIKLMGIDPDLTSGAKDIMQKTLNSYNKMCKCGVFKHEISLVGDDAIWTPMNVQDTTMEDSVYTKETELYNFMYSKSERKLNLSGGYFSHTSIGSYFMLDGMVDDTGNFKDEWSRFFSGIMPEDKIIIICSMFGGTGASGVPTIAKALRSHKEAGRDTASAKIYGVFLEPYFESENDKKTVRTRAFPTKSKMALEYYQNQGFDTEVFDGMYFLGENEDMMKVKHHESGKEQRNKANIIELYAATAVIDILCDNSNNKQTSKKIMFRGTKNSSYQFSRKQLNSVAGVHVINRVSEFMLFSVIFTKLFYHMINSKRRDKTNIYKFLRGYELLRSSENTRNADIPTEETRELRNYCEKYMIWLREIITEENPGYKDFDESWLSDENAKSFPGTEHWFARKQFDLYNCKPVAADGTDPVDMCNKLDEESQSRPGFTGIILGRKMKSTRAIYKEISDIGKKHKKQKISIAGLKKDILDRLSLEM